MLLLAGCGVEPGAVVGPGGRLGLSRHAASTPATAWSLLLPRSDYRGDSQHDRDRLRRA